MLDVLLLLLLQLLLLHLDPSVVYLLVGLLLLLLLLIVSSSKLQLKAWGTGAAVRSQFVDANLGTVCAAGGGAVSQSFLAFVSIYA